MIEHYYRPAVPVLPDVAGFLSATDGISMAVFIIVSVLALTRKFPHAKRRNKTISGKGGLFEVSSFIYSVARRLCI